MTVRVLVVDDDEMQLEMVERVLTVDGFQVAGATSVAAIPGKAKQLGPEVVLVDVNMPDATGAEIVAAARAGAPGAKVILYSAWEASKLRTLVKELGADAYLSKSDSVITIGKRIRELK